MTRGWNQGASQTSEMPNRTTCLKEQNNSFAVRMDWKLAEETVQRLDEQTEGLKLKGKSLACAIERGEGRGGTGEVSTIIVHIFVMTSGHYCPSLIRTE